MNARFKKQNHRPALQHQPVLHAGLQQLIEPNPAGVPSPPPAHRRPHEACNQKLIQESNNAMVHIYNFTILCRSHAVLWKLVPGHCSLWERPRSHYKHHEERCSAVRVYWLLVTVTSSAVSSSTDPQWRPMETNVLSKHTKPRMARVRKENKDFHFLPTHVKAEAKAV